MKNFSSKIECIKKNYLIFNKEYLEVLDDMHFGSFEYVWNYQAGKTIKRIKARSVIRFEIQIDGRKRVFYLKRHNPEFAGLRAIMSLFSQKPLFSEGRREFENICDFRKGGLGTVSPVAAGERLVKFLWVQSFLITEDFSPFIPLEYMLRDNPEFFTGEKSYERKRTLINKIGQVARKMHDRGFNHCDFNSNHILLNYKNETNAPDIALFDLQRVNRTSLFRFRWIIKSLSELNYTLPEGIFDKEDRIFLLLSYKGKKTLNLWDRLQWFWIKRKTARIKRHTEKIIDRKKRKKELLTDNPMGLNIQKTCRKSFQLSTSNPNSICPLCNSPGEFSFQGRDLLYNKSGTYQYMECINCNAVFQYPMATPTEIREFYPDDYSAYKELDKPKQHRYSDLAVLHYKYGYTDLHAPWLFRLFASMISVFRKRDAIPFVPNGKALDIGCGNGKFIRTMNSLGWQFEGVEFNPVAVEICHKAGLKVFHGDINPAGFKDNSFDLISARHIIEHIPDPENFMEEIARILKNGGCIVIRTPNSQALGRRWFGTKWFANDVPRHLILYNLNNLNMLAKRHGLRLTTEKTFTTPKIILNSWDYLTENRDTPSKKSKIRRLIVLPYVILSTLLHKGDEIFVIYEKS